MVAAAETEDPVDLVVFAQELASRLRVFKLVMLDRAGGLADADEEIDSFVDLRHIRRVLARERAPLRRAIIRAARRALDDGVASVNLTAPRQVYEELFSFVGTGTLFTEQRYANVQQISIDDFEEVEALIVRGQNEGFLLPRSETEIAGLLPSCFGYRVGDEHLAGVCALLTEPYRRERAGEITGLYTLTRFLGEGVASELVKEVIAEAQARRLSYVFACTSEERAARFFARLKDRPAQVSPRRSQGDRSVEMARLRKVPHRPPEHLPLRPQVITAPLRSRRGTQNLYFIETSRGFKLPIMVGRSRCSGRQSADRFAGFNRLPEQAGHDR